MDDPFKLTRQSMSLAAGVGAQAKALAGIGSVPTHLSEAMRAFQRPAVASLFEQYKDMVGVGSAAARAMQTWRDEEFGRQHQLREIISSVSEMQKSIASAGSMKHLVEGFSAAKAISEQVGLAREQFSAGRAAAKIMADQASAVAGLSSTIAESMRAGSAIQNYLKDFEQINRRWRVPDDVLDLVGTFKGIHDQLGKVALPTIDWPSAAALATALGQEGIEEQLSLLGIESDGSFKPPADTPEKGILSRKQADAIALFGLLMALLALYQFIDYLVGKASDATYRAEMKATMQAQERQIGHLSSLIEQSLAASAEEPEDRLVVRDRVATVRAEPRHGAVVTGELLANEIVYPVSRDRQWIEVEYYHWQEQEWQTGWVLKKYLQRVPANFSRKGRE